MLPQLDKAIGGTEEDKHQTLSSISRLKAQNTKLNHGKSKIGTPLKGRVVVIIISSRNTYYYL